MYNGGREFLCFILNQPLFHRDNLKVFYSVHTGIENITRIIIVTLRWFGQKRRLSHIKHREHYCFVINNIT